MWIRILITFAIFFVPHFAFGQTAETINVVQYKEGCIKGSVDISVNTPYVPFSVTWVDENNNLIKERKGIRSNNGQEDVDGLEPGKYSVFITDALCSQGTLEYEISEGKGYQFVDGQVNNQTECGERGSCDGSITDVTALGLTPPLAYVWTKKGEKFSSNRELFKLCNGRYDVTITDANGCSVSHFFNVCCCKSDLIAFEPGKSGKDDPFGQLCSRTGNIRPLEIRLEFLRSPDDANSNNGEIRLRAGVANENTRLRWNGPNGFISDRTEITNLDVGRYCVSASDGCSTVEECYVLVDCSENPISISGNIDDTCQGVAFGRIMVTPSGGRAPYRYLWDNNSRESSRDQLSQGNYCVTVVDGNGCTESACFDVRSTTQFNEEDKTSPCGTEITCNGGFVEFVDYLGQLTCSLRASDCRIEDCLCPLTGGVSTSNNVGYASTDFDFRSCQFINTCRDGRIETMPGDIQRVETIGRDPNCGNCQRIACLTFTICSDGRNSVITGVQVTPAPLIPDCRCRAAGSGCLASCGFGQELCVNSGQGVGCVVTGCLNDDDDSNDKRINKPNDNPKENMADLTIRLSYERKDEIGNLLVPGGITWESTVEEFDTKLSELESGITSLESLPNLSQQELYKLAKYNYSKESSGKLFIKAKIFGEVQNDRLPEVKLSPNPTTGLLRISISDKQEKGISEVRLYNAAGSLTLIRRMAGVESSVDLNLDNMRSGVYRVVIFTKEGYVITKQLVKI